MGFPSLVPKDFIQMECLEVCSSPKSGKDGRLQDRGTSAIQSAISPLECVHSKAHPFAKPNTVGIHSAMI